MNEAVKASSFARGPWSQARLPSRKDRSRQHRGNEQGRPARSWAVRLLPRQRFSPTYFLPYGLLILRREKCQFSDMCPVSQIFWETWVGEARFEKTRLPAKSSLITL